jgi:hypothetical protein
MLAATADRRVRERCRPQGGWAAWRSLWRSDHCRTGTTDRFGGPAAGRVDSDAYMTHRSRSRTCGVSRRVKAFAAWQR